VTPLEVALTFHVGPDPREALLDVLDPISDHE